jgi:hypothetical protein
MDDMKTDRDASPHTAADKPDLSGYDRANRSAKFSEDHDIADVDLSPVGAFALIGAAVFLMGFTKVRDWVRARIGSGR